MLKASSKMYRNIGGVYFEHHTSNPGEFASARMEAKAKGLKVRVINGEMFIEADTKTKQPDLKNFFTNQ